MTSRPHPVAARPVASDAGWLVDMVAGLAVAVAAGPVFGEGSRMLLWTERYEVWQIVWGPGAGSDWHAHGADVTAFSVVRGEVEERRRGSQRSRRLAAGAAAVHGGDVPHRLRCVGARPAVVLHAFSPPPLGPREAAAPDVACRPVAWGLKLGA